MIDAESFRGSLKRCKNRRITRSAGDDFEQAVNVGMLAGIPPCVAGMFGVNLQAFLGRIRIDGAPLLRKVAIDFEGALAAGLVFDHGDRIACRVK